MTKDNTELLATARQQVAHIHDKSLRERLIQDLADALVASEGERDELRKLITQLARHLSTEGERGRDSVSIHSLYNHLAKTPS